MDYKLIKNLIKEQKTLNKAMEKEGKKKEKIVKKLLEKEERNQTIVRFLAMSSIGSWAEETCSICMEQLNHMKREVALLSPCEHKFCHACICKWMRRETTCPICRCRVLMVFHQASFFSHFCYNLTMDYKQQKNLIKEQKTLNKAMEKELKKKEKIDKKLHEIEERNKTIVRLLAMSGIGSWTEETCSICLEELNHMKREVAMLSPCEHKFCHACICKWLRRDASCPICRCSVLMVFHQTSFL